MTLLLDDRHVDELLDATRALNEVERAFGLLGRGEAVNEPRLRVEARGTTLNVMSALAPTLDAVAVKSYPVTRSDVSQAVVILVTLYSHSTGRCLGIVQGDLLGQRRTAAASALATRLSARPESTTLTLFGSGFQAGAQVRACVGVLPALDTVLIIGRNPDRRDALVRTLAAEFPQLRVEAAEPEPAVRAADVVVTATSATEPLFDGDWLRPGAHVNAIGSNQVGAREIDATTLRRAARVAVDARDVAATESGDLLRNDFSVEDCVELGGLVNGEVPGRLSADEITVFESHGLALLDLVCGRYVLEAAANGGTGIDVDWPNVCPTSSPAHRHAEGARDDATSPRRKARH